MKIPVLGVAFLSCVLGTAPEARSQRIYVDASVASSGNGSSWVQAFKTLQPALAAAQPGTEVWVAVGTYTGGFTVPARVSLLGGFQKGNERHTQRNPGANRATLDGGGTQRVLSIGDQAIVDGFFVQSGSAAAPGGGGALVDGGSPVIRNCVFRLNTNTAGRGSALLITNNADPRVENCLFYLNGDATSGHTIEVDGARGLYLNGVAHNNTGDGFRFGGGSSPRIYNTIFAENSGRGITHEGAADTPVLENALFHNNGLALYRHVAQDLTTLAQVNALSFAKNNIAGDPLFVNLGANDYRLQPASPCVDAGSTTFAPPSPYPFDLIGRSRLLDGNLDRTMRIDIGAHEFSNISLVMQPHAGGNHFHPRIEGTPNLAYVLVVSIGQVPGLVIDPFGYWFLDPSVVIIVVTGVIPQTLTINTSPSLGTLITQWQAFAAGPGGAGNLSNPADLQIN